MRRIKFTGLFLCIVDCVDVRVVLIGNYSVADDVLHDFVGLFSNTTLFTAVDDRLLRQCNPFLVSFFIPIDPELQHSNSRKDMSDIVALIIFYRSGHFIFRPIVGIDLKIGYFQIIMLFGYRQDNMVQFLEFLLGQVRILIQTFLVAFIQLIFVMENNFVVSLIKDELAIGLLQRRIVFGILPYVFRVGGIL